MDALIHEFTGLAHDRDGHAYRSRACGRQRADGTWIGWLEFTPTGTGGLVRRSPRETTQPNRGALQYWALGLSEVYLDGALERASVRRSRAASMAKNTRDSV
jgi:hypothetical protein